MPFYNLKCKKCGAEFEKFAEISERKNIVCPECGDTSTETVWGEKSAAIIVKQSRNGGNCPNAGICGGCCHKG